MSECITPPAPLILRGELYKPMRKIRLAINGFGRIGRQAYACCLKYPEIEIVAVNDLTNPKTLAHLFRYDSVYGIFPGNVQVKGDLLLINGQKTKILGQKDPGQLPWKNLKIDLVIESTGIFTEYEKAKQHLVAGAKKVLITAPSKSAEVKTFVIGVNEKEYNPEKDNIISMASCTTNALGPVVKVLDQALGISAGVMTTCHSYTNDQRLLDLQHEDLRRARAAALSMVPASTGAATAIGKILPHLQGKLTGLAIRVPTPVVSLLDFVATVKQKTTAKAVNQIFSKAAKSSHRDILDITEEPLVSVDFRKNPHSAIIDAALTTVVNDNLVKVIAWYDNEWGYSCRLAEMVRIIGT